MLGTQKGVAGTDCAFRCVKTIGNNPLGIEMARLLLQHSFGCNRGLFFLRYSTITLKGEKLWIS